MANEGKLSQDEHDLLFKRFIERDMLNTTSAVGQSEQPVAIFLGGQPGAGKSQLSNMSMRELGPDKTVTIDIDELRDVHPKYREWQTNPATEKSAADLTQPDAGAWGRELFASAIENRRNIVFDTTLGNTKAALNQITSLQDAGYRVIVRAVAVQPEVSHLGVLKRFEDGKAEGNPRWVPPQIEKLAFDGLPKTLQAIETAQLKETVQLQVFDRSKTKLYDNFEAPANNASMASSLPPLNHERQRPLNSSEVQTYAKDWEKLTTSMERRHAPETELQEVRQLAQQMCGAGKVLDAGADIKTDASTAKHGATLLSMPVSPASRLLERSPEPLSATVGQVAGQKPR